MERQLSSRGPGLPTARTVFWLVTLVWAGLLLIRWLAPDDLMDRAQQQTAAYVQDIVHTGNWVCPQDDSGRIASKPPLYAWLSALASVPFGEANTFTLYLPCAVAMLVNVWMILAAGCKYFGRGSGLFAAMCYMLSFTGARQILLARTDTLFTMTVFGAALYAFRAWSDNRDATVFWLLAAAATLTKGPLGLLLASGGLCVAWWERHADDRANKVSSWYRSHRIGFILFLIITLGWFLAAWWQKGSALFDKMIDDELVGHALGGEEDDMPLVGWYKPPWYFLGRFAPWSILACVGLWRVWRRPCEATEPRRFERFLFCYFACGVLPFCFAAVHRADHLFPLLPAAALLAGREIARMVKPERMTWLTARVAAAATVALGLIAYYYFVPRAHHPMVARTQQVCQFAKAIERRVGSQFPLVHVDSPFALQFYLNTMYRRVSPSEAAQILAGDRDAFVVLRDPSKLESYLTATTTQVHEVARWPETGRRYLSIVSNHPRLEHTDRMFAANTAVDPTSSRSGTYVSGGREAGPVPAARFGQLALLVSTIVLALGFGGRNGMRLITASHGW